MEQWHDDDAELYTPQLLDNPAARPIWRGGVWFAQAFALFGRRWFRWMWLGFVTTFLQGVLSTAAKSIPVVAMAMPMLMLIAAAGILNAAAEQELDDEPPKLKHFFTAFTHDNYFNFMFLYIILLAVGFGLSHQIDSIVRFEHWTDLLLPALFFTVLLSMVWFVPPLVFLQGEGLASAIILGLKTTFRNILPVFVLMLLELLLVIAVVVLMSVILAGKTFIPFSMVLLAVFIIFFQIFTWLCCYCAYRDIWFEDGMMQDKIPT